MFLLYACVVEKTDQAPCTTRAYSARVGRTRCYILLVLCIPFWLCTVALLEDLMCVEYICIDFQHLNKVNMYSFLEMLWWAGNIVASWNSTEKRPFFHLMVPVSV